MKNGDFHCDSRTAQTEKKNESHNSPDRPYKPKTLRKKKFTLKCAQIIIEIGVRQSNILTLPWFKLIQTFILFSFGN